MSKHSPRELRFGGSIPGGIQNCLEQVGKLLRGKFVAFEVGDEFAIPGNNRGMQRMNEESSKGYCRFGLDLASGAQAAALHDSGKTYIFLVAVHLKVTAATPSE